MKEILREQLVHLDFVKNEYRFFSIRVESIGFNKMQVVTVEGKLMNRGREKRFFFEESKTSYKEALHFANETLNAKYKEGFVIQKEIERAWKSLQKQEKTKRKVSKKEFKCHVCGQKMEPETYKKTNNWGRGGGNWDSNPSFIGYQKVLCMDCQLEHGIYQKRIK